MPPFTIYIGETAEASVSLRYLKQPKSENRTRYQVHSKMAEALINGLMEEGFDPAYSKQTRYDGGLGHAFARVLKFLTPDAQCLVVPVMVNTYYPPAPSAKRCVKFGQTMASILRRFPGQERVVIVGSGGLSHTKDHEPGLPLSQGAGDQSRLLGHARCRFSRGHPRSQLDCDCGAAKARQSRQILPVYRPTGVGCAMGFAHWELN
jgi:hypothetical protein